MVQCLAELVDQSVSGADGHHLASGSQNELELQKLKSNWYLYHLYRLISYSFFLATFIILCCCCWLIGLMVWWYQGDECWKFFVYIIRDWLFSWRMWDNCGKFPLHNLFAKIFVICFHLQSRCYPTCASIKSKDIDRGIYGFWSGLSLL